MEKMRLKGVWRGGSKRSWKKYIEVCNTQIGQLLFYLVTLQLKRLQLYLDPTEREKDHGQPTTALGVYMEGGPKYIEMHS